MTAYDATPFVNQQVLVHSSSYSVNLSGLGSVVVINLDGAQVIFDGAVGLNDWGISGGGTAGLQTSAIANNAYVLAGGSAGLFDDGGSTSALNVVLADSGLAPTAGGAVNFNFDGTYDVSMASGSLFGQWFGAGSAHGSASIQTVYERFDLVAVPEPAVLVLILAGSVLLLRRRRA